ncbi:hypothetical protein EXU57_08830 [Segetibacter sp. 3557_3]|uniref:hypothetical protein n=1 Tax=Segetibacter sp. 3557_3 TaxID=2547429 RepID=UPI0010586465|nr:hypothetical protein [Segetibacter sp. 3557_3]TDH26900.1 hypothetical protein EXU57_08830 [Segetibacter sp. 3557_3]
MKKFEKSAWNEKGDLGIYPNRDKMLKDIMNNHRLRGLTYTQLVELLGEPEDYSDVNPNTVYYNVVTEYGRDIDPVYLKNLEIGLSSDSVVIDVNIKEFKH